MCALAIQGAAGPVRPGRMRIASVGVSLPIFSFVARTERSEVREQDSGLPRISLRFIRATFAKTKSRDHHLNSVFAGSFVPREWRIANSEWNSIRHSPLTIRLLP